MKKIVLLLLFVSSLAPSQCLDKYFAGVHQSFATTGNGTLWSWGPVNSYILAQNGDTYVPTVIANQTHDWKFVAAGELHAVALKNDNTLHAWGMHVNGEFGYWVNEHTEPWYLLFSNALGNDKWKEVLPGFEYTIGIKEDGTLWSTGRNEQGELGIGTNTNSYGFTQVGTDLWRTIAVWYWGTYGIKEDGTLWKWGAGVSNVPYQVGTDNDWLKTTTRYALKNDGSLWDVFDHTNIDAPPVQLGSDYDWMDISSGDGHTLGLKSDGTLWSWGTNSFGQLGYETDHMQTSYSSIPQQIGVDQDWTSISTGAKHSMAQKSDGSLWTWGNNERSRLGHNNLEDIYIVTPTQINCASLSTEDLQLEQQVTLYPNPVDDILTLQFPDDQTIRKMTIYDLNGKAILKKHENIREVNLSHLKTGLYLVTIQTSNSMYQEKFLKK